MQDFAQAEPRCLRCLTFVFQQLEKLAFYIRLSACNAWNRTLTVTQTIQTKHLTPVTKLGAKRYPYYLTWKLTIWNKGLTLITEMSAQL